MDLQKNLIDISKDLSDKQLKEVIDFAEFLIDQDKKKSKNILDNLSSLYDDIDD